MTAVEESPVVLPADPSFGPDVQIDYPGYRSTRWRVPERPLVPLPEELHDLAGPVFGGDSVEPLDADLTRQHEGEPLGERIVVSGRVLDDDGRPVAGALLEVWQANAAGRYRHDGEPLGERIVVSGRVLDEAGRPIPGALVEVWQANAAGRYRHDVDMHPAPLDPSFSGAGRCLSGDDGSYRFTTIKPGAYPWLNHPNAWRPAHIHFSIFGRLFTERLVTQMYFPGDPLFAYDPIFNAVRDPHARELLIARLDMETTEPEWALGFCWDIVLGRGGRNATPLEARP